MNYRFENVPVEQITVKSRIRQDLGDLQALAENIRRRGLINPITLTSDLILIAGFRRLEAVKLLKWPTIPAEIIDNQHEEER